MLPQEGTQIGVCKGAHSHTHTRMYTLFSRWLSDPHSPEFSSLTPPLYDLT